MNERQDWFDFLWYCSRGIHPSMGLLSTSIDQSGPWADKVIDITQEWFRDRLTDKINSIDWEQAARDMRPFLSTEERRTLDGWKQELIIHYLHRLFPG